MQRILVPTDFSENAKQALVYARDFAHKLGAELVLFHAYHIPYVHAEMPAGMYQSAIDEAQEETENQLQELANKLLGPEGDANVPYQLASKLGFAVETILSYAEEIQADLILMGTQGVNGLADVILGSITSSVVERAELPVMAIPEGYEFKELKNLVFATNYDTSDLAALKHLVKIATAFNATIHVVHVNSSGNEVEQQQSSSFKNVIQQEVGYDPLTFEVMEADDVASGIESYSKTHQVDAIALVKRKRNLLESLFHTSITRKMSFHSKVPFLAYHE